MHYAIILAAGKSQRMGPQVDKAFLSLGSKPVLAYSLAVLDGCADIDGIVVVVRKDRVEGARNLARMYGCAKVKHVVAGGARRRQSLANGLAVLDVEVAMVTVHDASRPCLTSALLDETIKAARRYGSGAAAVKLEGPLVHVDRGLTASHGVDAARLWDVQTPQTYKREVLEAALAALQASDGELPDECAAAATLDRPLHLVAASPTNARIATPDDLPLVTALLKV